MSKFPIGELSEFGLHPRNPLSASKPSSDKGHHITVPL